MNALDIVKQYYNYFNQKDYQGMLALLHPDVRHEPNQGEVRIGLEKFSEFLQHMDESYEETLTDQIYYTEPANTRVACQFVVNGIYKKGEDDMPKAHHQTYVLPAASFLEVLEGKITRVTTYYNLPLWIKLVS